jgi:DNA-binding NtrC family response regulator
LRHLSKEHNLSPFRLTTETAATLRAEPWPGNVRQLRHVLEAAALHATMRERGEILPEDIELEDPCASWAQPGLRHLFRLPLKESELEYKRLYYRDLLARFDKLKDAAAAAQVSEETMRKDRKRLGLGRDGAALAPA